MSRISRFELKHIFLKIDRQFVSLPFSNTGNVVCPSSELSAFVYDYCVESDDMNDLLKLKNTI